MKFLFLSVFFLTSAGIFAMDRGDVQYFNRQIQEFRSLMESGDSRSAYLILSGLEQKFPENENLGSWFSHYHHIQGRGFSRANQNSLAIKHYQEALRYRDSEGNRVLLAASLVANKDYFEAALFMENHLDGLSQKSRFHFMREAAHSYSQIENYKAAIYHLRNLLFENPGDTNTLNQLAVAYLRNDDDDAALELLEQIKKYRPLSGQEKALVQQAKGNEKVKGKYRTVVSSSFEIQIDNEKYDQYLLFILGILEKAYMDLGRIFNYYPKHKTRVKVLTDQDFTHITGTNENILGLRTNSSKELYIRFGKNIESSKQKELKRVLWHEYNHHLLLAKTRGLGNIPSWFTEGLAVFYEPDFQLETHRDRLKKLDEKGFLFNAKTLPPAMSNYSMYIMAASMVHLLNEQGTLAAILVGLKNLNYRYIFEDLFRDTTGLNSPEFTNQWNKYISGYLEKHQAQEQ
jgi:tetratricopeptide (TPR) repeat protein